MINTKLRKQASKRHGNGVIVCLYQLTPTHGLIVGWRAVWARTTSTTPTWLFLPSLARGLPGATARATRWFITFFARASTMFWATPLRTFLAAFTGASSRLRFTFAPSTAFTPSTRFWWTARSRWTTKHIFFKILIPRPTFLLLPRFSALALLFLSTCHISYKEAQVGFTASSPFSCPCKEDRCW